MSTTLSPKTPSGENFYAQTIRIPYTHRVYRILRLLYVLFISENPLTWGFRQGKQNPQADLEGPYFIPYAPSRQISESKAVMATLDELKASNPLLLSLRLIDPSGKPLHGATINWWQASASGEYDSVFHSLRGTCTTGGEGTVDVLSVPPGKYGPQKFIRAGHVHVIIRPPVGRTDLSSLVTQLYVCRANDEKEMGSDFINYIRSPRTANLVNVHATRSSESSVMELPTLDKSNTELADRVEEWDKLLSENNGNGVQVDIVGKHEIKLNKKHGWF